MVERYGYLIKSVTEKHGRIVIEFHDSQVALQLIGKALGLFRDQINQTNINVMVTADDMAEARRRVQEFERGLL